MKYDNFIDSITAFGKLKIETSGLSRNDKELAKERLDCTKSVLKVMSQFIEQNSRPLIIDYQWINQVKKIAVQHSVEKVVFFPYPLGDQRIAYLIRVYGGDKTGFFEALGWKPLTDNSVTPKEQDNVTQLENKYGIILYENH